MTDPEPVVVVKVPLSDLDEPFDPEILKGRDAPESGQETDRPPHRHEDLPLMASHWFWVMPTTTWKRGCTPA